MNDLLKIAFCIKLAEKDKLGPPLSTVKMQPSENKPQESSYAKDFLAGFDPMGVYTFQAAKENELSRSQRHGMHRAVGTIGGVVGGAIGMTPVIAGTIGAVKGFANTKGNLKQRLAGAAAEGGRSAVAPFSNIYHGVKAKGAISALKAGERLTDSQAKSLQKMLGSAKFNISDLENVDINALQEAVEAGASAARSTSRAAARAGDEAIQAGQAAGRSAMQGVSQAADKAKEMARSEKVQQAGDFIAGKIDEFQDAVRGVTPQSVTEAVVRGAEDVAPKYQEALSNLNRLKDSGASNQEIRRAEEILSGLSSKLDAQKQRASTLAGKIEEGARKAPDAKQRVLDAAESAKQEARRAGQYGERAARDIELGEEAAKSYGKEISRQAENVRDDFNLRSLSEHQSDIEQALGGMSQEGRAKALEQAEKAVGTGLIAGASGMLSSGAISGAAANVQYASGVETGKEILRARERGRQEGIKHADYRRPILKRIALMSAKRKLREYKESRRDR